MFLLGHFVRRIFVGRINSPCKETWDRNDGQPGGYRLFVNIVGCQKILPRAPSSEGCDMMRRFNIPKNGRAIGEVLLDTPGSHLPLGMSRMSDHLGPLEGYFNKNTVKCFGRCCRDKNPANTSVGEPSRL